MRFKVIRLAVAVVVFAGAATTVFADQPPFINGPIGSDIDGALAGDQSGFSVSLSSDGTTVAVGAPKHDSSKGQVRVFELISGSWVQLGSDIDGEAASDYSGYSVSLSSDGTTVAI